MKACLQSTTRFLLQRKPLMYFKRQQSEKSTQFHLWNRIHPTKTSWLQFQSSKILWSSTIHKNNMAMCPIVSACGIATYNITKFISKIIQNYSDKTSSFVKDSTDFIQKFKHLSINAEGEALASFDVSTLFTSIPVPVALQVINSKISTGTSFTNICKIPTEIFIKLLEFTNTNHIFCFNKKFYKQLQGAAMHSPVSPVIANIYMEHFESLAIPTSPPLIKWWFRYVDVHSATRKDQVNKFQEYFNAIDPHINSPQNSQKLPFLEPLPKPLPTPLNTQSTEKPPMQIDT